jgi:tetratricopeptide (TPR) repeat protein
LTRYLTATYQQDLKEAYAHLSASDRAFRSLETFISHNSAEESIVVAPLMRRTTFEIEHLEIQDDRARAVVQLRQPNLEQVMGDLFNTALSSIGSGMDPDEFDEQIEKRYRNRPVPMITLRRGFGLVREGGKWRVSAGWPQEEQIGRLVVEAGRLEESGQLKEAKGKYEEALALNENLVEIHEAIAALEFRMKPMAEAQREARRAVEKMLEERRRRFQ